jgi:hypothetical protein
MEFAHWPRVLAVAASFISGSNRVFKDALCYVHSYVQSTALIVTCYALVVVDYYYSVLLLDANTRR